MNKRQTSGQQDQCQCQEASFPDRFFIIILQIDRHAVKEGIVIVTLDIIDGLRTVKILIFAGNILNNITVDHVVAADIMDHGIMMTGGGALLANLDKLIAKETGMPVIIADDALSCVGEGTGKSLENMNLLKRVVMTPKKLRP